MIIESSDACGTVNEIAKLMAEQKYILSFILIALGAIFLFFGGYKWNVVLAVLGFLLGFLGIIFFFWTLIAFEKTATNISIILVVALVFGIMFSTLFNTFEVVSFGLIGFFCGYVLTSYLLVLF